MASIFFCNHCNRSCSTVCHLCGMPYHEDCIILARDTHKTFCASFNEANQVGVNIGGDTVKKLLADEYNEATNPSGHGVKLDLKTDFAGCTKTQLSQLETLLGRRIASGKLQLWGIPKYDLGKFDRKMFKLFANIAVQVEDDMVYIFLIANVDGLEKLDKYMNDYVRKPKDQRSKLTCRVFGDAIKYIQKNPHNVEKWLAESDKKIEKAAGKTTKSGKGGSDVQGTGKS
jgi:hypothetical protein